jgi:hypothetical protein
MRYRECENCQSEIDAREVVTRCPECKELINNPKTKTMNNFKEKDTVYHYKYGEGIVREVYEGSVLVKHGNNSLWHNDLTLLSFTPYTLEGFTQERPFEPVVGQMYYFWDRHWNYCSYAKYLGKSICEEFPYVAEIRCNNALYQHISKTPPKFD